MRNQMNKLPTTTFNASVIAHLKVIQLEQFLNFLIDEKDIATSGEHSGHLALVGEYEITIL
jgi:hypothetical protein